jgi:DNA helicase II / ATP-dependent DNA helicase PcrA
VKMVADLHIHSCYSRACSKQLSPESLHRWSQLKGITVLATGDFTHPRWFSELQEKLQPAEPGLLALKPGLAQRADADVPASCRAPVRFVLGVEISCIYKKAGRVRKVHHLVFAPSFEAAARLNRRLEKIGNIGSDGRPILGLDSRDLLSLVLETDDEAHLIPAHIWTPHFAVFGSESGFDSLEECFGDLTSHIFAAETGLSSDPAMNWRVSGLDNITLISNSDAHSPEKLAREANVLEADLSYRGIFDALRRRGPGRLTRTLEFFPEEGKYHWDGHRPCGARLLPEETRARKGLCPACGKPVTVGVLHRVEALADRPEGRRPSHAPSFDRIIPLKEVLGETLDVGPASVKVDRLYHELLGKFGNELAILRDVDPARIEAAGFPLLAVALTRMRQGTVSVEAGYDGAYGVISALRPEDRIPKNQMSLL